MPQKTPQPCALLFCSEQHLDVAQALARQCEQAGLAVHLCTEGLAQSEAVFQRARQSGHQPVLVVHGGGTLLNRSALSSTAADFESAWRSVCFTGAVIGQQAMTAMLPQGQGTVIFLGHASAAERLSGAAAYGAASAGLRSLAQSMAREGGPKGLHVAHVLLHGDMQGHGRPQAQDVAAACWQLHQQDPSTWTHELDLRPSHTPS
ncbi:MAG: SDR family oxidoreductase [Aquabacterium sp.]|uniref:SDR family oxidoreductase n=1 Tax=Aquabacterium sp. TaxID=1872578 RepID=UPI0025BF0C4E|nr:SDR family oxidoreductase [Aquabacterium sp.]MBI5925637.1 SDR family oxidoreductase [Aquabacterium sp.]